jgi:hypothetical protein
LNNKIVTDKILVGEQQNFDRIEIKICSLAIPGNGAKNLIGKIASVLFLPM